jgi:hypothetical protein
MAAARYRRVVGVFIAGSMIFSSTGAIAATSAAATSQADPWAALSVMNGGASAAAVCGAAAAAVAAAQPAAGCVLPQLGAVAPPVQPAQVPVPVETAAPGGGIPIAVLALGALLGAVLLYIVLHHGHHNHQPNSPA